jgi:phage-related minor tail protein
MADGRIKGITIELDGETTGLQKALSDVTKQSMDIQKELKDVDRLLKFDPSNVEAMAQKQKLLAAQIEVTSNKLNQLKAAEQQVQAQFERGDIGESQYRAFRREIEYTEASLGGLRQSLTRVDDAASLRNVRQDLSEIPEEADNAEGSIKDLGGELTNLLAGAAAAGGIGEIIGKALDASSFNTKINLSMDVSEESMTSIKKAISTIETYGVDGEAALEGVRRQWALNKDASDESNIAVINGAATISAAYAGVDFTELIQETNEISKAMGISNEEALALTNSLLKAGFPPEQIDIIAEYGTQLQRAGYNAEEIQALFAAGVNTGTWNIDNLMDGLKEGRVKVTEFGQGLSDAMIGLIDGTNISAEQMQSWGNAVAAGGEGGSQAMNEIAVALQGVDDETKKNALGVGIFGTIYEDQGQNIIDTLINAKGATVELKNGQDELNNSTSQLNADPAIMMQQAIANLTIALTPLLLTIAGVVASIAEWAINNPNLTATIVAIVTTLSILIGIAMGLAPIFTAISSAAGVLGTSIAAVAWPITIIVAAIAALIAIGVLLYKNWDYISAKAIEIWGDIKEFFLKTWADIEADIINAWDDIKEYFSQSWTDISNNITSVWTGITTFFSKTWENIKASFISIITAIIEFVKISWENLKSNTESIFNGVLGVISNIWNSIKTVVSNLVDAIKTTVSDKFEALKSAVFEKMNGVKDTISKVWNEAQAFLEEINLIDIGKNVIQGLIDGITSMVGAVGKAIRKIANNITDGIKDALDIHSPSRVMKQLGEYTGEGFIVGIRSTIGEISKQSQAMASAAIPDVSMGTSTATSGSSQSSGSSINQTVNIYSPSALSASETAKQNKRVLQELALAL